LTQHEPPTSSPAQPDILDSSDAESEAAEVRSRPRRTIRRPSRFSD